MKYIYLLKENVQPALNGIVLIQSRHSQVHQGTQHAFSPSHEVSAGSGDDL